MGHYPVRFEPVRSGLGECVKPSRILQHSTRTSANMFSATRALVFKHSPFPSPSPSPSPIRHRPKIMNPRNGYSSRSSSSSPSKEEDSKVESICAISQQEWQGWGSSSPVPSLITAIVEDMKAMEIDMDGQMSFGGKGGKLQGDFKLQEDKKHRATYQALSDSESKLQFYSARQIACRLLGSRGYLCQKCWLASEDCMCSKVTPSSLWHGMRFWVYMHPKDFLRQNNTGKLLWQLFGVQAATLCLYGISEHEEIMWNAFERAGKNMVWCLYPNKNASPKSVQDILFQGPPKPIEANQPEGDRDEPLNFILIDGTWNNSAAMFRRLKEGFFKLVSKEVFTKYVCAKPQTYMLQEHAQLVWGDEDLPCISLMTLGASPMHKLRPQPSWDRTCTAAAAIGLLSELHLHPEFNSHELDKQAETLEDALEALLEALTSRRLRMGRSITRRERHSSDIC